MGTRLSGPPPNVVNDLNTFLPDARAEHPVQAARRARHRWGDMVARSNVLDSDHLRRQTNGDGDLERELLALFEAQCGKLVPFILAPGRPAERAAASHALRGGALAIGAEQLAGVTHHLEEAFLLQPEDAVLRPLLSELRDAATELAREVARWRDRAGAGRTGSRQG